MTNLQPQPAPGKPRRQKSKEAPAVAGGVVADFKEFHKLGAELLGNRTVIGPDGGEYKLSFGAVCLFSVYLHWSSVDKRGDRVCYAGNKVLAKALDCGDGQIREMTTALEAAGLVCRRKRDGKLRTKAGVEILRVPGACVTPDVLPISGDANMHPSGNSAYVQNDGCTHAENRLAPTPESGVHPRRNSSSTYAGKSATYETSEEREEKETLPQPPHVGFGTREAPSSPSSPASAGPNPKTPPAGDGGEPVETPSGVYFPTGRPSAALDQGGGEPDEELEGEDFDEEDPQALQRARIRDLAQDLARRDGRAVVGEADVARALETFQAPAVQIHLEGRDQARALKGMMAEAVKVPSARSAGYRTTAEQASAASAWNALWRVWHKAGEVGPIPPWTELGVPMPESVRTKFRDHERATSPPGAG